MKTPIILAGLSVFWATGCCCHTQTRKPAHSPPATRAAAGVHPAGMHSTRAHRTPLAAVAVLSPTRGSKVSGVVRFVQEEGRIRVSARVTGLSPGGHGFHVHEFGDCSDPEGKSAGGHYNPESHPHGGPAAEKRHAGDLGNLTADSNGNAVLEYRDRVLKLHGPHSILGRSVIVHAQPDDLKSQPTGAAGARAACGIIGVAGK